jgi:uncharacterized SAM-binding protein YcdF (DUF218 family)
MRSTSKHKQGTRWRRVLLVLLLALGAWTFLAWAAAQFLIVEADLKSADAIVVLSGSSTYIERTSWAANLYKEGRAPIVLLTNDHLLSGWDRAEERNPYFYELAAQELRLRGVPAEKIQIVPGNTLGTYEESLEIRDFATAHHLMRLLVVTSAYHSRRALWSMRRATVGSGIVIGINSAQPGWQTPSPWNWWLHRWGWKVVAGEYAKMIYYWWKY